jgi:hypothetical protein
MLGTSIWARLTHTVAWLEVFAVVVAKPVSCNHNRVRVWEARAGGFGTVIHFFVTKLSLLLNEKRDEAQSRKKEK